jgi:hypothetical protein
VNYGCAGLVRRRTWSTAICFLVAAALATGCSKADKYKEIFMRQCSIVKPMEEACSCTYDRMTAKIPVHDLAAALEQGQQDPRVAKAISEALAVCTAKYR